VAPFLIEAVSDRPVRAFTMLRDPVELVVSNYLFAVWQAESLGRDAPWTPIVEAMREREWTLRDVYLELGDRQEPLSRLHAMFLPFFNIQSRHLLLGKVSPVEMPFCTDGRSVGDYRERAFGVLADTYVAGTQDRFSQSVRLFADSFNWRRAFVPRANVGPLRSRAAEVDAETRRLIRSYNSIDAELHGHYSQRLAGMPSTGRLRQVHGRSSVRFRRRASAIRHRLGARVAGRPA
jgi:hypothetical protein